MKSKKPQPKTYNKTHQEGALSLSFFCDFETYKKQTSAGLTLNVLYLGAFWFNGEVFYYKNVNEFLNLIINKTKEHKAKKALLYFYNLTYDATVLTAFIFRYKIKIKNFKYFLTNEHNFINLYFEYRGVGFYFFDLWNFDKSKKLSDWLKFLDVKQSEQKGQIVYDKWNYCAILKNEIITQDKHGNTLRLNKAQELEYLANDVKNLYNILLKQQEITQTLADIFTMAKPKNEHKSIPGVVYDLLHKSVKKHGHQIELRDKVPKMFYIILKRSFTGGHVSYNLYNPVYKCKPGELIYYYDRRSAHPYVLAFHLIPFGPLLLTKPEGEAITWVFVKLKEWKNKVKYDFLETPFLPGRLVYSCDIFAVTLELWEVLQQLVDIVPESITYIYQKATKATNSLYKSLYKLKDEAPDPFTRSIAKLALNAPFGKLGEKSYDVESLIDKSGLIYDEFNPNFKDYKANTAGMYVAQISRMYLLKTIKNLTDGGYTVLYDDTDSVTFAADNMGFMDILKPGDNLGDWKLEGVFHEFYNLRKSKNYLLINNETKTATYASGGIPKSILDTLTLEELKTVYNYDHNIKLIAAGVGGVYNEYGQALLSAKDIETNNGQPVTHYLKGGKLWKIKER